MRDDSWWQCGSPDAYHDLAQFDLDTECCSVCGMSVEEYWLGYESAIYDTEGALNSGAYRIRRATARSRPTAAMYTEESANERSAKRPERAYICMGMGE